MGDFEKINDRLERDRMAAANNTAAIAQEIGAMPDPASMVSIRLNVLIDTLYGEMELDADGHYIAGSRERLEFEVACARAIEGVMVQIRENVMEARARQGLLVPDGVATRGGIVLPGPGAVVQ